MAATMVFVGGIVLGQGLNELLLYGRTHKTLAELNAELVSHYEGETVLEERSLLGKKQRIQYMEESDYYQHDQKTGAALVVVGLALVTGAQAVAVKRARR